VIAERARPSNAPALATPVIELRGITKVYGAGDAEVQALRGVDLAVRRGALVAVMGPSGCGKSTLMNILGALDRPTAGAYMLDGEDVSELDRAELAAVRNAKLGFVFQSFNLLPRTPALKQVMLPMLYARERIPADEREARAVAALEAVGLGDRLDHRPNELSGGQQQRVAIARALVLHPPLVLADEPTGNLDTTASAEIMAILGRLHAAGTTIVMVTHAPDVAARAERVVCLRDGRVVSDGPGGAGTCLEAAGAAR
jgi:putative ABC transport system ATP-binding protein